MTTLKELNKETDYLRETLVIDLSDIVLFLGILDDGDDYYYVLNKTGQPVPYHASCVGRIISLIDKLEKDEYNWLVSIWNLNNERKIEEIK